MKRKIYIILLILGSFPWSFLAQINNTNSKVYCELRTSYNQIEKKWQVTDSTIFSYNQNGSKQSASSYANSIVGSQHMQTKYSYNTKNQRIQETYFQWNDTINNWNSSPFKKAIFTYNQFDSLETICYEIMELNRWNKLLKWEIKYDQNKYKTAEIGFVWSNNAWTNTGCQKFTYEHLNNNCISKTNYTWDEDKNQFKIVSKTAYSFYKNRCESSTNYVLNNHAKWQKSTKDSLIYANNNRLIGKIGFVANHSNTELWDKVYQISHTMDQTNHITKTTQTNWNSKNNAFKIDENTQEINYSYSKEGLLEGVLNKHFDGKTNQFVTDSETFYINQPASKTTQNNKERS